MPLIQSGSKKAIGMNIRRESSAGKPHKQSVAIALNVARKNGMNLPPPPNSINVAKKAKHYLAKVSGQAERDSPFYKDRPECQDSETTMHYLEDAAKDRPTSVDMEKSLYQESLPPRSDQPFSPGTADQLSDKPPFMRGA